MGIKSMLRRVSKLEEAAERTMDIHAVRAELTDARDQLVVGRKLVEQALVKVRASAALVRVEIRKVNDARRLISKPANVNEPSDPSHAFKHAALTQRLRELHDLDVGLGE